MFEQVTVIGLGLIGGSFAMAVKERHPEIVVNAVDPVSETLQFALRHRIADEVSLTPPNKLEGRHLVVLAAHLSANRELLTELAPKVAGQPDVLITDVGSCKRLIVALGAELLPEQFIGAHPMAGKERSGIEHATSLLFAGKTFLLCPHTATPADRLASLQSFFESLGARPQVLEASNHDRTMAFVSHLPQLYATALSHTLMQQDAGHLLRYHGGGLDDQMRLAASPYAMWREVFEENADNLQEALTALNTNLSRFPLTDAVELAAWFEQANLLHDEFQRAKGALAKL